MLRVCVFLGTAAAVALGNPAARFVTAIVARDFVAANALCERGQVPPGVNLHIPDAGGNAATPAPLIAALRDLVDEAPEAINLLACVVQKRIAPPPPDGGAELLWLAAMKQHVRLAAAVLAEAAPFEHPHVDAKSRAGVLHAALLNRIFVLDVVHRTLLALEESRRGGGRIGAAGNATVAWLEARGAAVARHVSPPAAAAALRGAVAALVHAASGGIGGSGGGPLRAVLVSDAQLLANGLSLLLVRVLLDGLAKHATGGLATAAIRAEDGAVVSAASPSATSGLVRTVWAQWLVLRELEARDRFGRSPLHAAAATGNAGALRVLIEAQHDAWARALKALAGAAADAAPPVSASGRPALRWCVDAFRHRLPPHTPDDATHYEEACRALLRGVEVPRLSEPGAASSTALARLSRFIRAQDARGTTAIDAACLAGYDDAAAILADALDRAGSPQVPLAVNDPAGNDGASQAPWLLQHVPSWSAAFAAHGWQRSLLCASVIDATPRAYSSSAALAPAETTQSEPGTPAPSSSPDDPSGGWRAPAHTPRASTVAVDAVLRKEDERWPCGEESCSSDSEGPRRRRCDFDVVDGAALSPAAFQGHYQARGRPVLMRGLANHWPLRRAWTLAGLTTGAAADAAFGSVGRLPYAAAFGAPATELLREVSLGAFVRALLDDDGADARYVFDSPASPASRRAAAALDALGAGPGPSAAGAAALLAPLELIPPFLKGEVLLPPGEGAPPAATNRLASDASHGADATPVPLVRPSPAPKPQVFVGGPGSGAPLHYHTDAWNALAFGRKHWWLLPPSAAAYSAVPPVEWAAHASEAFSRLGGPLRPFECVQEAGDVVYVPAGWAHAVLNTGRNVTVGAAVELALEFPAPGGWVQP